MAQAAIANIINPERLSEQLTALFPDKMVLANTGAVLVDPAFLSALEGGGDRIKIPRWKRMADFDNMSESAAFTRANMTTDAEYGFVVRKGKSYGVLDTAALVSMADPSAEIKTQLSEKIARAIDASMVGVLRGAIPSGLTKTPTGVVTSGTGHTLSYDDVIDAAVLLGDNHDMIRVMVMHSKVYADALKANLVTFVGEEPYIMGKRVFVSDLVYKTADSTIKYSTYLLGPEALYLKYQAQPLVEFDRDIELACDIVAASVHYCSHMLGMSFTGTPAAAVGPTDAELATTGNWTRVAEDLKSIRAVALITN